jgi:hypothetical protein
MTEPLRQAVECVTNLLDCLSGAIAFNRSSRRNAQASIGSSYSKGIIPRQLTCKRDNQGRFPYL